MDLLKLANDFADALKEVDASGSAHKSFRPGVGPFSESEAVKAALAVMKRREPLLYGKAETKRSPDLLIPGEWQVELKVIRPFGDNGKEAESWSQNLLHPYPGNTSSIGDCIKLLRSEGTERKAIVVFGYEHDPAIIPLDNCIVGFELLALELFQIRLSPRMSTRRDGLVHPVHEVLWVYAWQVQGSD